MAEIKSTLDLVLEKTKHLSLSAEEKAEIELQGALKRVPGYVKRILERVFSPQELLQEIEALPQQTREPIRRETARQVGQALDLSEVTDPLLTALELLVEPAWAQRLVQVKQCRLDYRQTRDAAWRKLQDRILAELADAGIRGSAVAANPENDPRWLSEESRLRHACEQRFQAMRQALV